MKKLYAIFFVLLIAGCNVSGTGETGPQITIAEIYEIALTVDTKGEVHLSGEVAIPTPIRTKIADLDWLLAFDLVFNEAKETENTLYLLYEDQYGTVIKEVYKIDRPFEIVFARDEWVRKLQHTGNGNIIVFVERRAAVPPDASVGGEQKSFTDVFYDLPEDGEVLNRFCTDDWETCRGIATANANWQNIEVASIGGGLPSGGYLIERFFLFFDTASIPSGATIRSATLYVHTGQWLNGNTTIHVVLSHANIPLTTSSFQEFTNKSGGSVNLSVPFDWGQLELNDLALGWIVPNGITKLALIHENDLYNIRPTEPNDVLIATGEDGINRPYLVITYTARP